jgi:uncharacterized protein YfaS (alpha-2-macroglobulin family)
MVMRQLFVCVGLGFLAVLLFGSCNRNTLRVRNTNFGDEIALTQNLVFEFNRPVKKLTPTSTDRWDSTAYVKFSPAVPGRFKWLAEDKLLFSPAFGFKPCTNYQAEITDKIGAKDEVFTFHTPFLQLTEARVFWASDANGGAKPTLIMGFNYKVKPEAVLKLLQAEADGKKISLSVAKNAPAREITLVLNGVSSQTDETLDLNLKINKGLGNEESAHKTDNALTYHTTIPNPRQLQITTVNTHHDGSTGTITVHASHELKDDNVSRFVQMVDASYYWNKDTLKDYSVQKTADGLEISGTFPANKEYQLTIRKGLRGIIGEGLSSDEERDIIFGVTGKGVQFESKRGLYLSSEGERNIAVRLQNVEEVTVKVAKVYENNIQPFIRQNLGNSYYEYYEDGSNDYQKGYSSFNLNEYYDLEYFGDLISTQKVAVNTLPRHNGAYVFNFNFNDPKKEYKGVYVVEIVSGNEYYARACKLVAISDIGILVKKADNNIVAFTHSLQNADALDDVQLNLVSHNNQIVMKKETDSDGRADFADLKKNAKGFDHFTMITARYGEDFNFILLDKTQVPTSRFDVGGKNLDSLYDAFIYGERDLYRPGEKVQINCIVRNQDLLPEKDMPVVLSIDYPNGENFNRLHGQLNEQGSLITSFDLPPSALTGRYAVTLKSGADQLIQTYEFYVEEFTPDRIRVNISLDKEQVRPGEKVVSTAQANFFFGAPAANRPYEVTFNIHKKDFRPKAYSDYNFQVVQKSDFQEARRTGQSDAQGGIKESFDVPESYRDMGLLEAKLLYSVFDESKRPVHRYVNASIISQPALFGIKKIDRYVGTGTAVQLPIIALNHQEQVMAGTVARVKVVRFRYDNVLRQRGGTYTFDPQRSEAVMSDKSITLAGSPTPFSFIPPTSGEYEVRVSRPGAQTYVAWSFFSYGWGTTENSFEVNTDGEITIQASKTEYKVGENAEILFKTPFDGKLLVSVEQRDVLEVFQVSTEKSSAKLSVKLKDNFVPNVYVSATLIRPVKADGIPFTVAHGFQRLKVKDDSQLEVIINAKTEVRSRTKQSVFIQTIPNAEVTVAVVDEGILQLRNTPTPNPHGYFYADRALGVTTHDVYTYLFPEISLRMASAQSSTGGDGIAGEMRQRINPFLGKRFNLTSFFSGRLKANSAGQVRFDYLLPQFAGELRIMAVAYKGKQFGSGTKSQMVVDPIVINTALPRFLSPEDEMRLPVTLHNSTNQNTTATITVQTSGAVQLKGKNSFSVNLSAKKENTVPFELVAKSEVGIAKVKVIVQALGETFSDETEIGVRPANPYEKTTGSGSIASNQSQTIRLDSEKFLPQTVNAKLVVGTTPFVQLSGHLADLVQYPFGCVEQTISTAFPQIYFTELIPFLDRKKGLKKTDTPAQNIRAAIAKLQGLQLPNGGLAYWSGNDEAQTWASIYGLHFALEAKKAEFNVPERFIRNLTNYVQEQNNKELRLVVSENDDRFSRERYGGSVLQKMYGLYVLTLAGQKPISSLNYFRSLQNRLDPDARFLLACTYLLTGDESSYRAIVPKSYTTPNYPRETGYTFSSPLRDQALVLNTLLESDPNNPLIGSIARNVSQQLKNERYPNTQELTFALLALGKLAKRSGDKATTWKVTANGQALTPQSQAKGMNSYSANLLGKDLTIQTTGKGTVYYYWEVNGVRSKDKVDEKDYQIAVRREFLDRSGRKAGTVFKQNDLIVVHLTLKAQRDASVENIVVTDLLPAGLEIENTRLSALPNPEWTSNASTAEHTDYRDDRVHFFTSVSGDVKHFYYLVRAVSPGKFRLGPVSADAMYNGDYRSYHGAGTIVVE